jgi:hypothetical protein
MTVETRWAIYAVASTVAGLLCLTAATILHHHNTRKEVQQ